MAWIRVGDASIDLESGRHLVAGADTGNIGKAGLEVLHLLVDAGAAGCSSDELGGGAKGSSEGAFATAMSRGQQRVKRLKATLGEAAGCVTVEGGRYVLVYSHDELRSRLGVADDTLVRRVAERLTTVSGTPARDASNPQSIETLLRAPSWIRQLPVLRYLPPLLGTDRPVPLATVYMELRLAGAASSFDPSVLGPTRSLADALAERRRRQRARSRMLEDAIGENEGSFVVILGDPGAGKSSLLRREAAAVAAGERARWQLPLLVDLPTWWEVRLVVGPSCGLEVYACAMLIMRVAGPAALRPDDWPGVTRAATELVPALRALGGGGRDTILFLCDGLDELVGDRAALSEAVAALKALRGQYGCVVASRPAGFPGGLGEDAVYSLCDLDLEGIQGLVDAWFRHRVDAAAGQEEEEPVARGLGVEIITNPRLLEMARNPFLLTLLCQLAVARAESVPEESPDARTTREPAIERRAWGRRERVRREHESAPTGAPLRASPRRPSPLPLLRAAVYEEILALVHRQAQARTGDATCLDSPTRAGLAALCCALQQDPAGPRHFFDAEEWGAHAPSDHPFERAVLPARVVTRWTDSGRFHMVHLTFHEFFVARAIVDSDRLTLLEDNLFRPGWTMIVRFAAGILAERGRMDDVVGIVRRLTEPGDLLGRTVIEAAAILVEAGVRDPTPLLGYDLRERLWTVFAEGRPFLEEGAAEALGVLDPGWTVARAEAVLEGRLSLPEPDSSETSLAVMVSDRPVAQRLLNLLGVIPDPRAEEHLVRRVLAEGTFEGTVSAIALAARGRRSTRRRLVRALTARPSRAVTLHIATYAARAPHLDFVPGLTAALKPRVPDDLVWRIVDALLGARSVSAWYHVVAWVDSDGERRADRTAEVADLACADLRSMAQGELRQGVETWLGETWRSPSLDGEARAQVYASVVRTGLGGPELAARIRSPKWADGLLAAMREGAESGVLYADEAEEAVAHLSPGPLVVEALHAMDLARWLNDQPTKLRGRIEADLDATSRRIRISAMTTLATMEATEVLPRLLDRVPGCRGEEASAIAGAIGLLAPTRLTRAPPPITPELHQRVVACLEAWLDATKKGDLRQQAADSLAFWDFAAAGRRRADRDVRTALARACAETGRLAFEEVWLDPAGNPHSWS